MNSVAFFTSSFSRFTFSNDLERRLVEMRNPVRPVRVLYNA